MVEFPERRRASHSRSASLPKGAARRCYASNSFEVHLQAENVATIDSKCWRVGVDLRNLELSAWCQPADVPDMDARLKADEAQFRQGNPTSGLADAFAAYNRDRPLPKSSVYPSASNAMPPVLYSTLLPGEAVKDARIVCRALGGINATESGYWTPAAMITVPKALPPRQMPEIAQRDRGVVAKRALKNPESLIGVRDTRAWLKGVARRVLADQLGCRGPTVELGACPDETAAAPDAHADEEDERRLVREAVRGLRKSLRVPLRLKWWRGWSCERIAVRLGITVPAVWGRLHKAYAELKRILKPPDRN